MLKKLSLAALIAMSGVSFASATPLTEAIKNVNVNGYMRIRFYNENNDDNKATSNYNRWRTNAKFVFSLPVAENINLVWRISDQTDVRDRATSNVNPTVDPNLTDNLFFLKYSANGLNAIVGKIPVLTPITSADSFSTAHGAGAIATYNVGYGLTVAAGWVDAVKNAQAKPDVDDDSYVGQVISNDIYTAALIYSNKAFGDAQLWYFNATKLIDYEFVLRANINLLKDYNVAVHFDGAVSNLDDDVATAVGNTGDDSHTYYHISATYSVDNVCAKLGFAQTNDKIGVATTSVDAPIDGVATVDQRQGIANLTDAIMVYGKVGYNVDPKTSVCVAAANIHDAAKANSGEYEVGAAYKFNKKFGVNAYYSVLDYSDDAEAKGYTDNNEFRFEAKYSF